MNAITFKPCDRDTQLSACVYDDSAFLTIDATVSS
jgi:hypothetical protein